MLLDVSQKLAPDAARSSGVARTNLLEKIGLAKADILEIYHSPEIDSDVKRLHAELRSRYGKIVPAMNHAGGIAGVCILLDIAEEVFDDLHTALTRSVGVLAVVCKNLDTTPPAFKKTYKALSEHLHPDREGDPLKSHISPGGLIEELVEDLQNGSLSELVDSWDDESSGLLPDLVERFSEGFEIDDEPTDIVRKAILEWAHEKNSWNVSQVKAQLVEWRPFLAPTSISHALVLYGLDIHRDFLEERQRLIDEYGGDISVPDQATYFGWQGDPKEYRNLLKKVEALHLLRQGESLEISSSPENAQKSQSTQGAKTSSSPERTTNFKILRRLDLEGASKDEVLAILRDPEIDFNFRKFTERQNAKTFLRRFGGIPIVQAFGIEAEVADRLRAFWLESSGQPGHFAKRIGFQSPHPAIALAEEVGLDLAAIPLPAGHLLSTFDVTKEEVLEILQQQEWTNASELKGMMLTKLREMRPEGPIFEENQLSHARLFWGLDIIREAAAVIDYLQHEQEPATPKSIGRVFGFDNASDKIIPAILNLAQDLRRSDLPLSLHEADRALYLPLSSGMSFQEREAYLPGQKKIYDNLLKQNFPDMPGNDLPLTMAQFTRGWAANASRLKSSEARQKIMRAPMRGVTYISPLWRPYRSKSGFGFRTDVEATIAEIRKEYEHCDYFWIETSVATDSDGTIKPVVYVAGLDFDEKEVVALVRLIETSPYLFRKRSFDPRSSQLLQDQIFETLEQHGYHTAGSSLCVRQQIEKRVKHIVTMQKLERYDWDDYSGEHLYVAFDDFERMLYKSRQAAGALSPLYDLDGFVAGHHPHIPSSLEVPFVFRSVHLSRVFELAREIVEGEESAIEVQREFLEKLTSCEPLKDLLGFQKFLLNPAEQLFFMLDQEPDGEAPAQVRNLALKLHELATTYQKDIVEDLNVQQIRKTRKIAPDEAVLTQREMLFKDALLKDDRKNARQLASQYADALFDALNEWVNESEAGEAKVLYRKKLSPFLSHMRDYFMPEVLEGEYESVAVKEEDRDLLEALLISVDILSEESFYGALSDNNRAELFEFTGDLIAFVVDEPLMAGGDWERAYAAASQSQAKQADEIADRVKQKLIRWEELSEEDAHREVRARLEKEYRGLDRDRKTIERRKAILNELGELRRYYPLMESWSDSLAVEEKAYSMSADLLSYSSVELEKEIALLIEQDTGFVHLHGEDYLSSKSLLEGILKQFPKKKYGAGIEELRQQIIECELHDEVQFLKLRMEVFRELEGFRDQGLVEKELFDELQGELDGLMGLFVASQNLDDEIAEAKKLMSPCDKIRHRGTHARQIKEAAWSTLALIDQYERSEPNAKSKAALLRQREELAQRLEEASEHGDNAEKIARNKTIRAALSVADRILKKLRRF